MTTSRSDGERAKMCHQKLMESGQSLGKGLVPAELQSLEQSIGHALPSECRALLSEFGQASINGGCYAAVLVPDSPIGELLFLDMLAAADWAKSTEWCKKEWSYFEADLADDPPQCAGPAQAVLINEDRVLISMAHDLYWFIDFAPAEGGRIGQVIMVYAMPQDSHVFVIAPDLISFFEMIVTSLSQ
jgi:cell wall assembly regulator SMI1